MTVDVDEPFELSAEPGSRPGEFIDSVDAALESEAFAVMVGVDERWVFQSRWGGFPVLLWPAEFVDGDGVPCRRWPGLDVSAMWHPLVWLPDDLAERYESDEDGGPDVETDEEWACRVWMECVARGVYDPENDSWVDLLDAAGLDLEDPKVQLRLASWLDGGPDPVFDNFGFPTVPGSDGDGFDPDWARRHVLSVADGFVQGVAEFDQVIAAEFFEGLVAGFDALHADAPEGAADEVFGLVVHHVNVLAVHNTGWESWGDSLLRTLDPLVDGVQSGDEMALRKFRVGLADLSGSAMRALS